uniref:Uncharacterized protein n=1 Tax=viral metagenome TaxID=1070528 RepID=A0A6C0C6C3_9ZZZZ
MSLSNMITNLTSLFEQYKEHPEIISKMEEYMSKQFPHALELYVDRINRKHNLEKQSNIYIDKFLNNPERQYFYIQQSSLFVFYNGENYSLINEDTVWHILLSDISTKEHLIPWKHKIKNSTIKQIKEKSLTISIPESNTIQYVIQHLTPVLFRSKSEAKHFLTLLGDNILKKADDTTYFTRIESNDFLICLHDHVQCILGTHCLPISSIKFKYHNQEFKNCGILSFNDSVKIRSCWDGFLKSHILDLIAVACHYSNQFQNASIYIETHCQTPEVTHSINYLSTLTKESLVNKFTETWLEPSTESGEIKWVEMYYLWKRFILSECRFPVMPVHIKDLKYLLGNKINYNESLDLYSKVTSSKLSYVKTFQSFWEQTISEGADEFEISELWSLYIKWMRLKDAKVTSISEDKMHFLIEHFAGSQITSKYVTSIKCNLWDKQSEMNDIINQLKVDYNFCQEEDIAIFKLYRDYCTKILETPLKRTVSKKYFEKYISKIIPSEYIQDNNLLKQYWCEF